MCCRPKNYQVGLRVAVMTQCVLPRGNETGGCRNKKTIGENEEERQPRPVTMLGARTMMACGFCRVGRLWKGTTKKQGTLSPAQREQQLPPSGLFKRSVVAGPLSCDELPCPQFPSLGRDRQAQQAMDPCNGPTVFSTGMSNGELCRPFIAAVWRKR